MQKALVKIRYAYNPHSKTRSEKMNNRDMFEIDEKQYEELIKIAEAQLDYEKKEILENGESEDDYFFTYRVCPDNKDCPIYLYIIRLDDFKEQTAAELELQMNEFQEDLEALQLEFEDLENGWDKTLFTTEEEYWENFYEIEDEIFSLKMNISLCKKFINDKSKRENPTD